MVKAYDFDTDSIVDKHKVADIIREYGVCRIPNYLTTDKLASIKEEALDLVTKESQDDYAFGKATKFFRQQINKTTIKNIFGSSHMDAISKLYLDRNHDSNREVFITHDYKHDNGLARNGFLHFDRIHTFKYFIYLSDVNENCGPFSIVPKSHTKGKQLRGKTSGQYQEQKNRILLDYPELGYTNNDVVQILGNAGDLMIFDTDTFHMGGAVKKGNERLIIRGHTR